METVNIFRLQRSDQGTFGKLHYQDFSCYTLELPWRNNQSNISCIPAGEYATKLRVSPKFGQTYWVTKVENRAFILIHSGNWAGDVKKGFKTHVNGCILLGKQRGLLAGQLAVLNSRITVKAFMEKMLYQPFNLKIYEAFSGEIQ